VIDYVVQIESRHNATGGECSVDVLVLDSDHCRGVTPGQRHAGDEGFSTGLRWQSVDSWTHDAVLPTPFGPLNWTYLARSAVC